MPSEGDRRPVDIEPHRELLVLEAIAANEQTTQRSLASQLGIALGLTNLYLKRLVLKGLVKCVNVQSNRVRYLLTPKGLAEKSRLTYEFMDYSLRLYRDARQRLRTVVEPVARRHAVRIAIYGTGEAAELAYLCLKECGVEPVAIFGNTPAPTFLGIPVVEIGDVGRVPFDAMVVATLDDPAGLLAELEARGVAREKLIALRAEAKAAIA